MRVSGSMSVQSRISFAAFLLTNFLFALKYASRVSNWSLLVAFFIIAVYTLLYCYRESINFQFSKWKFSGTLLLMIYVAMASALFWLVPKESLHVDRWSVIESFWDAFNRGDYVYYAKSFDGNHPGPMPFYFILTLPFYLLGEQGFFSLLGLILFAVLLQKSNSRFVFLLLICGSLFYFWEIYARSNIFSNAALVLVSMVFFFRRYESSAKSNLIFGIIIGLLLSTRNVFIIPYISLFIFALRFKRMSVYDVMQIGLIAVSVFVATFLPFVWNHLPDFMHVNPFVIQSSVLMPLPLSAGFIVLATLLSFCGKKPQDVYFVSGLSLFLTILGYLIFVIQWKGFQQAFYGNVADLSYLILAMPFFLYTLFGNHESDIHASA